MSSPTLDLIVSIGNRGHHFIDNSRIVCEDGENMSVIAGGPAYCRPRPAFCGCSMGLRYEDYGLRQDGMVRHDFPGPYTHVEVGFISVDPGPDWKPYEDGEPWHLKAIYACVPVELVRALIASHGGEKGAP